MARYYKRHVCVRCGCYYGAFSSNSTHCPDCIHEAPHVCKHCGKEFKARKMDSEYCDRHRYMQSPAYLAKREAKRIQARLNRQERNRLYRERKMAEIVVKPKKEKKAKIKEPKKKIITEAVILEHRPVDTVKIETGIRKPEEKFFLQVGKARYGFISQERMNRFKKLNGIE